MFSFSGFYWYFSLHLCCRHFDHNMPCGGLPWWLRGKQSACNAGVARNTGSIPGSWKSRGGGHCNHSSILASKIPWTGWWAAIRGHKESDMAEELSTCALLWFCFSLYWPECATFCFFGTMGGRGGYYWFHSFSTLTSWLWFYINLSCWVSDIFCSSIDLFFFFYFILSLCLSLCVFILTSLWVHQYCIFHFNLIFNLSPEFLLSDITAFKCPLGCFWRQKIFWWCS